MNLFLQFGWGMMTHCHTLAEKWEECTVILSPRDLENDQMERFSSDFEGRVLLDPQAYIPSTEHERINSQVFWPDNFEKAKFDDREYMEKYLIDLLNKNRSLNTTGFVLPGYICDEVDETWLDRHQRVLNLANEHSSNDEILIPTFCLSESVLNDEDQIQELLNNIANWDYDKCYLVPESIGEAPSDYFYTKTSGDWLTNLLDFIAGVTLHGKDVIQGYSNQQMLISFLAGAEAICTGNWSNVRKFSRDKFIVSDEDQIRRKTTWYYSPQSLSEYKIDTLDTAYDANILEILEPHWTFSNEYTSQLFQENVPPSTAGLREPDSFLHYLTTLQEQITHLPSGSFESFKNSYERLLDESAEVLRNLHQHSITGDYRDFKNAIDVNREAITQLEDIRGARLKRNWPKK